MQSLVGVNPEAPEEYVGTESEFFVAGSIVDSWVESARAADVSALLILQVAPQGHHNDLIIVEAEVSLVPDRFWLEDLSENLCNGSLVVVIGSGMSKQWEHRVAPLVLLLLGAFATFAGCEAKGPA
jgi:hypothetical protein